MSQNPIRYGVVGLGRAGWSIHVAGLRDRADAKIVAVVDPLEERRKEAAEQFGCKTYTRLASMLKQDDVEVVVVATPSVSHGPDSKKALKAGKHVVTEKPMALSVAEADSMIRAAEQADRKLFVHQNYRFNPESQHLFDVVRSGKIGRLYHIRNYSAGFNRRNDWQTLSKNGGGVLSNTCRHNLDVILQLLGAPVKQVMGDLKQIASAGDVEDHVKAFIRAENGVTAAMEVTSAQRIEGTLPKWVLAGTCGTLTSDGRESTIHYFDPTKAPPIEAVDGPVMTRAYGNKDELPWQVEKVPAVGPSIGNFYDNVHHVLREGGAMYVTPQSVREVIRTIALIRKGTDFPGKPVRKRS